MPRDTDLEFKSGFSSPGFAPAPRGPSLSATLTDAQVAAMYGPQKFAAALEIAVGMVPGRTAESVKAMMPPIPVLAGGLAAWAAGHFFGPSWLMDAALVLGLGVQGVQASWYLLRAGLILRSATTARDIHRAAEYLADVIAMGALELLVSVGTGLAGTAASKLVSGFGAIQKMGLSMREYTALKLASAQTGKVIAVRCAKASRVQHVGSDLIPKPLFVHATSDPVTGLVLARNAKQSSEALGNGYYIVRKGADGTFSMVDKAGRSLPVPPEVVRHQVDGLIIDPDALRPLYADIDLFDVFSATDVKELLVVASESGVPMKDISNSVISQVIDQINFLLGGSRPPVQHGPWMAAELPIAEAGDIAFFWPDGSTIRLTAEQVIAMYEKMGRTVTQIAR